MFRTYEVTTPSGKETVPYGDDEIECVIYFAAQLGRGAL